MHKLQAFLLAIALMALPTLAHADGAGSAIGVKQQAAAKLGAETRMLRVGSDIFIGDRVQTGVQGQVQILFADRTELVLGPGSALTIEDYLIRNDGSAGKLAVDILAGSFRFATGDSAKNRYTIDTPTGTIGVRGTEFDGWVDPADGTTYVIRHGGTVIICDKANTCDVLDDICEVGRIASGEVAVLGDARGSKGATRSAYKRWFRYTENQAPLLRQFWFPAARDCLNALVNNPEDDPNDSQTHDNGGGGKPTTPSRPPTPTAPTVPMAPTDPITICTNRIC